jgi:prepilin-type N-terminal cleavage/methylation domain-containing protein
VRDQRGFTLIELMIVVAIISLLTLVAVPAFFKDSRKARAKSEVSAVFTELQTKEEQYLIDNGSYLAAAACPTLPAPSGQDATACVGLGTPWKALRVQIPTVNLYCSYEITAGPATTAPTAPTGFTMPIPATGWYYIVATCDMDGSSTLNSTYFVSNVDTKVQGQNEGF